MNDLTYKELKELIKDKDDAEVVIILHIGDYTDEYKIERFLIEGKLVIGGVV